MTVPRSWAEPYEYFDAEDGRPRTGWNVMVHAPGYENPYVIARYTDEATAKLHARIGRKP